MRMSDWSSDVCSSDLGVHGKTPFGPTLGLMSTTLHPTALCDKGHAGALYARLTDSAPPDDTRVSAVPLNAREPGSASLDTARALRSEEHTSELQSLMRISYAVFCFK